MEGTITARPSASHSWRVRLEVRTSPERLGRLITAIGLAGCDIGELRLVESHGTVAIREVDFKAGDGAQVRRIVNAVEALDGIHILEVVDRTAIGLEPGDQTSHAALAHEQQPRGVRRRPPSVFAVITDKGASLFEQAAAFFVSAYNRTFSRHLSDEDVVQINGLMEKIVVGNRRAAFLHPCDDIDLQPAAAAASAFSLSRTGNDAL